MRVYHTPQHMELKQQLIPLLAGISYITCSTVYAFLGKMDYKSQINLLMVKDSFKRTFIFLKARRNLSRLFLYQSLAEIDKNMYLFDLSKVLLSLSPFGSFVSCWPVACF